MRATTSDIGLAIRDFCEGHEMSILTEEDGELVEHVAQRRINSIDVSNSDNPIIYLDNGQKFLVRIFAVS